MVRGKLGGVKTMKMMKTLLAGAAMMMAVTAITYIPSLNLETSMLQKRFGEPAQKIMDSVNHAEHWLYPDKGLDIALNKNEKDVLQYVSPKDFDKLVARYKSVDGTTACRARPRGRYRQVCLEQSVRDRSHYFRCVLSWRLAVE